MSHEIKKPTDLDIPSDSLWAKLPVLGAVLGLAGLGATFATLGGEGKARAMFGYLWAYEFALSLALGAMGFVLLEHVTRAAWSVVVRRVAETAMATLPFFAILWLPIGLLGMHELYPWTHENDAILERKRWFLSEGFFFARAGLYFVVWSLLGWYLYSTSVRRDRAATEAERDALTRRMWGVSAAGIPLWGLTQSFQAVDWLMSLQPHWYSTIFGVYFFAGSILAFVAFLILVSMGLQKAGVLKSAITTEHFHDLGKYLFGYTIFWAYIAFSQFVLIWYANIPEETEFYMVRLEGGWEVVSYALPLLHFFVPFLFLLSRHIKRSRFALAMGAIWLLVLHAVDLYWLVLPNFGGHGGGAHAHLSVSWVDGAALVGLMGFFLAAFGVLLKRNKVVGINDPRLVESLAHENY